MRRGLCASIARRLVEEDEIDQGYYWIKEKEEFWLSFMKRSHYHVLMDFGLEREVPLPFIGTPVEQIPVRPFAAGASSSYGYTFPPTPPVPTGASGVPSAMAYYGRLRYATTKSTDRESRGPRIRRTAAHSAEHSDIKNCGQ